MPHRTLVPALVLLAACAGALRADISPEPLGGGVTPGPTGEKTDVAMTAEEVDLALSKDRLDVVVTFHLENLGAQTTLQVGFPMTSIDELKDFKVEIDGKKEPPALVNAPPAKEPDGHDFSYWLAWDMSFAPGGKKTVVVSYNVATVERTFNVREEWSSEWEGLLGGEEAEASLARRHARYILVTGAPWKGPIGKAVVRLALKDGLTAAHLRQLSPPPVSRTDGLVEWSFTDLEPTEDIEIAFCPAVTVDREIEIVRGVKLDDLEAWDRLCFRTLIADLLRAKGDGAGMRAAYEDLLDTIIAEQGEELSGDKPCTDYVNEIATNLFTAAGAKADPATAARAKKACEFLERWIAAVSPDDDVCLALIKARKALGRDWRDLVRVMEWGGPEGKSLEFPDVRDFGKATLEEERVEITVGADSTVYDTTYVVRARRDGEATATLGDHIWPVQAELIDAAEGTFDNLAITVNGVAVKVRPVSLLLPNGNPETRNEETRPEHRTGWTVPLKAGQTVEIRVRLTVEAGGDRSGWGWKKAPNTPPDDERRFDCREAAWTATGECWTTPRKVTVAMRLPEGVTPAHIRRLAPDSGALDGVTARWGLDRVDTSRPGSRTGIRAEWKGFTRDEEILHLRKLLDSKPAGVHVVRFHLALALRQAGRLEDGIAALEELIAAKSDPHPGSPESFISALERDMTASRPLECLVLEARRELGDDKATRAAAGRAVEALKAKLADHGTPYTDKDPLSRELAEIERSLGREKEEEKPAR